ncbi:hypothetical protein [Nonomuraea sp. SBT364]|uniref:hypothetical protein n=1 Tax=Nonomuraea sp. SBT364 TaxID=1580530 RepID=UPI00066EED4B|nr:hypothetical protein [Nonomuraea sp. SBT364]
MPAFTHLRDESRPFGELSFPEVTVLDVGELRRRWSAWFDLSDSAPVPLRSRHAVHLARMLTGEAEPVTPHWFSTISVTSARHQVAVQARSRAYLCAHPGELPQELRTPRWHTLADRVERWAELTPSERVTVVSLLTQLGFHRTIMRLAGTLSMSAEATGQQLAYEIGRAAFQLNRKSPVPHEIFGRLAEQAGRPALRVLSALQLVSALSRGRDHASAARWLGVATRESAGLSREPGWLAHLVTSRYHRAAALHELSSGDREPVIAHMRAALDHDDALATLVDDPVRTHYQHENRALVLEAYLKLDTFAGTSCAPADAVARLRELDPVDPEPLYAIGAFHASRKDWQAAREVFWTAAGSGTLRGAEAARAAAVCSRELGLDGDAALAHRLCVELDPASKDIP